MKETTLTETNNHQNGTQRFSIRIILSALIPLLILGMVIFWFIQYGNILVGTSKIPIEEVTIQRMVLKPNELIVRIQNTGPMDVTIAQVIVNEAIWKASFQPSQKLKRMDYATITIPYHWVEAEPVSVKLVSSTGITFEHSVEVATITPQPTGKLFLTFALLGIFVGVIPITLGLMWLPFLQQLSDQWYEFLLCITLGLLVFLGVDAFVEAIEASEKLAGLYQGIGIITVGLSVSILLLFAIGNKTRQWVKKSVSLSPSLVLAYLIAFGIGVHNLGEGLAIGGSYAVGEIALGTMLVLGFTIHNVTEGVAIVAPLTKLKTRFKHLVYLGILGGVPTILGTWIGGFTYSDIWAVLFLAIGAGAVFQVIIEISRQMINDTFLSLITLRNVIGFFIGLMIMYITGLFVTA